MLISYYSSEKTTASYKWYISMYTVLVQQNTHQLKFVSVKVETWESVESYIYSWEKQAENFREKNKQKFQFRIQCV
jgi:hypothetical protein